MTELIQDDVFVFNPTTAQRFYSVVLRLVADYGGSIFIDHGIYARAAFMKLMRSGNAPLAEELHDGHFRKPFTVSHLSGGRRHFESGQIFFNKDDVFFWRFTFLMDEVREAVLVNYLSGEDLSVWIGKQCFRVVNVFMSPDKNQDAQHINVEELKWRWGGDPYVLNRKFTLDFRSPTIFRIGDDATRGSQLGYRVRVYPDPRLVFSSLRKRWVALGGDDMGDEFDVWVRDWVELDFPAGVVRMREFKQEDMKHMSHGFVGKAEYRVFGRDLQYLPYLYLLTDLALFSGVGSFTTRGLGEVRRI